MITYSVVNYDPVLFASLKETIDTSDARIALTENLIEAADLAAIEWS